MAFWILVIIGFLVYLFISTKNDEIQRVENQGGLVLKYRELIGHFLSIPGILIERKTSSSIVLAVKDNHAITRFTLIHGLENLGFFWSHRSVGFGDHSLKWDFPSNMPQEEMIEIIENGISNYSRKILQETGVRF